MVGQEFGSTEEGAVLCDNPPPLSDEAISAALDGEAPAQVLAHLEHCGGCTARLEQAQRFERVLAGTLHRWDCPPSAQLGDYHLGLLTPSEQRAITAHLRLCRRCSTELEELRTFLNEDIPAAEPRSQKPRSPRRLDALVARLLPAGPGLQLEGVRGAGDDILIAQSSAATIVLDPQPAEHESVRVVGQVMDEVGEQHRWSGALVEARQAGVLVATAFVDDLGVFSFGPIATGITELRVTAAAGPALFVEGLVL